MRAPKLILNCLLMTAAFAGVSAAASLQKYMMLTAPPASCGAALTNPPAPVTSFLTTDAQAYLWFYVTGVNAGDVASSEYYTPSGQLYGPASGSWDAVSQAGNYCFLDAPFTIAGAAPALLPGLWTIQGKLNGTLLFTLTFTIAPAESQGTTVTIPATANIFAAGRDTAFDGTLPPSFSFTAGSGAIISFTQVTGSVTCMAGGDMNGPDGSTTCAGGSTNLNSYQGISGIVDQGKAMFLTGVFLNDSTPADPAPPSLDFTNNENFTSLTPQIGQTFFIGDGLTGTGTGTAQQFVVPAGATRLFLGIADGFAFQGDPGAYGDNSGSLTATFTLSGGQPATCTYTIDPASQSFSASGGNGVAAVTAGASCAWTAQSNDAWITVSAGASGTGNGTVSYSVTANTTASSRTGTLTIGGETYTVNQTASACSDSLSPTSVSVGSAGITNEVLVIAGDGCPWTAVSNASWIAINSGASGTGNGAVGYTVGANTSTSALIGTLTIAGQTFTVNQAAASVNGAPAIALNGVVNAASYMPANLPGGAIARGSLFSIFGSGLGPVTGVQAAAFPLGTVLGGVGVSITQGSTAVDALPLYVSAGQINAVMPSNAPLGDVQITVTYNGNAGAPTALRVVNSNFGAFNTAGGQGPGIFQDYVSASQQPLNTRSHPAKPGQIVTLWGTGLGPISAPDNIAPPSGDLPVQVKVLVGNKPAQKLYSGRAPCCAAVDEIVFKVPSDAVAGCYVPVQVQVGDSSFSNAVTMAIDPKGQSCSDPANPFAPMAAKGGKSGIIVLLRASANAQLDAASQATNFTLDLGVAIFQKTQPTGDLGFSPWASLPPVGTCSVYTGNLDLNKLLSQGTNLPQGATSSLGQQLDAGPALSITGPDGTTISMPYADSDHTPSPYAALLGGVIPVDGVPALPLFLNGGSYQITGPGGTDVGPFSASVTLPAPVQWTNRDQITTVDRTAGLTLTWSGGDANSGLILVAGVGTDQTTNAGAGFFCFVPPAPGSFTIPASVLGNLPADPANNPGETVGALLLGSVPGSGFPTFSAPGLDFGMIIYSALDLKTVHFQ
jgi:uncharacterized protein (TIGR03437 family)